MWGDVIIQWDMNSVHPSLTWTDELQRWASSTEPPALSFGLSSLVFYVVLFFLEVISPFSYNHIHRIRKNLKHNFVLQIHGFSKREEIKLINYFMPSILVFQKDMRHNTFNRIFCLIFITKYSSCRRRWEVVWSGKAEVALLSYLQYMWSVGKTHTSFLYRCWVQNLHSDFCYQNNCNTVQCSCYLSLISFSKKCSVLSPNWLFTRYRDMSRGLIPFGPEMLYSFLTAKK